MLGFANMLHMGVKHTITPSTKRNGMFLVLRL